MRAVIATRVAVVVVLGPVLFGLLDAALWRSRDYFWVANMSSAYLALPFGCAATMERRDHARPLRGALAGVVVTLVALTTFYLDQIAAGYFGPLTAGPAFLRYAVPGLVTGAAFGALGSQWAHHRSPWPIVPLGAALLCEPVAWRMHLGFWPSPSAGFAVEAALGAATLALCLGLAVLLSRRRAN